MAYFDQDRSAEFGFGGPRSVAGLRGIAIHTSEGGGLATSANALTDYQLRMANGSYHVVVDRTGHRLRQNTDSWITYSTGNQGNQILNHICFTAKASMTRAQWLAEDRMLRAGASVAAHWCKTYGWPAKKVTAAGLPGILGHADTRVWGSTDHTDPGPSFPWDVFTRMVQEAMNGTTEPEGVDVSKSDRVHHELTHRFESRVEGSTYRDTVAGFVLNTDAAAHRTEVAMAEVLDRLDRIEQALEARK